MAYHPNFTAGFGTEAISNEIQPRIFAANTRLAPSSWIPRAKCMTITIVHAPGSAFWKPSVSIAEICLCYLSTSDGVKTYIPLVSAVLCKLLGAKPLTLTSNESMQIPARQTCIRLTATSPIERSTSTRLTEWELCTDTGTDPLLHMLHRTGHRCTRTPAGHLKEVYDIKSISLACDTAVSTALAVCTWYSEPASRMI